MKKIVFTLLFMSSFITSAFTQNNDNGLETLKSILKDVGTEIAGGFEVITEGIEDATKRKIATVYGKVKIKKIDGKQIIYLKSTEGNLYEIRTFSNSETSMEKLAVFKNKNIKATGIINKEKQLFSIINFELYN